MYSNIENINQLLLVNYNAGYENETSKSIKKSEFQ
jgi:hypothetical protein